MYILYNEVGVGVGFGFGVVRRFRGLKIGLNDVQSIFNFNKISN